MRKIFISIASFCDPFLNFTVRSALENARFPDRLSFGVVDQSMASVEAELPAGGWRIAYLFIDPRHSRGASWARSLAMTLYAEEDYFLQIDSHTCFDRNWDIKMIDAIENISMDTGNQNVILSTRPFAFEILECGTIKKHRFTAGTLKLIAKSSVINLSDPVLHFTCEDSKEIRDIPGFQVSAAYIFTRGHFVEEVPYDPYMYFHGEEQNIAVRAYTNGWDIWHPNMCPIYHLYKNRTAGEAPLHWDDKFDALRAEKWAILRERASSRLSSLLQNKELGVYSLGKKRKLEILFKINNLSIAV